MKRNRRLDDIKGLMLIAASVLFLQAFSSSVANAQRKPVNETEIFRPQQGGRVGGGKVGLPGSNPAGVIYTIDQRGDVGPNSAFNNCRFNVPGPGFTCDFYESDINGNPSEISPVIVLPNPVIGGYIIMKDNPAIADTDTTNWSDILQFGNGTSAITNTMQLFSKGCGCFPTYAQVIAGGSFGFFSEVQNGTGDDNVDVTSFFGPPNTYNVHSAAPNAGPAVVAPNRPWTGTGSTGTIDEDSTAFAEVNNFTVGLAPTKTGTVTVRYNITATDGVSSFCPATQSVIRARLRNTDNTGSTAKITFEIHSTNITSGGNQTLFSFNSNGLGSGSAFVTRTFTTGVDFDFANNVYWLEVKIFRSDATQLSNLGSIQIWESAGTACP